MQNKAMEKKNEPASSTAKIIIVQVFLSLAVCMVFYSKLHIFCVKRRVVKWRQGKERRNTGEREEVGGSRAADRTIGLLWM